jgi:hypothetical protein
MFRTEVLIMSLIAECIVFLVLDTELKPMNPECKPVSAFTPTPSLEQSQNSNAAPTENTDARNGMESTQFRELHSRGITEFWQKCCPSIPFVVLIWLVMLPIIRRWRQRIRQRHKDVERLQKWNELEMTVRRVGSFLRQWERSVTVMQDAQVKHCDEFQKEIESLKQELKNKEKLIADFPNEAELEENKKAWDERSAKLQNGMEYLEQAVKEEDERLAQLMNEIDSITYIQDIQVENLDGKAPIRNVNEMGSNLVGDT